MISSRSLRKNLSEHLNRRLDQVRTDLQNSKRVKDSQELLQDLGLRVLKRADEIRARVAKVPLSPSWLKNISLVDAYTQRFAPSKAQAFAPETSSEHEYGHFSEAHEAARVASDEVPAEGASMREATASEPAEEMQPAPMRVILEEREALEEMGPEAVQEIEEFTEGAGTIIETADVPAQKKKKRAKSKTDAETSSTSKRRSVEKAKSERRSRQTH